MSQRGDYLSDVPPHIGRWAVAAPCGQGTYCRAYYAHSHTRHKAILKIYRLGLPFTQARDKEKTLLTLLHKKDPSNRRFLRVYDSFEHAGHACLVTEFLDFDLNDLKAKNGGDPLPVYIMSKLTTDILLALNVLHTAGFTHADLKLSNVMWSATNELFVIIDYGLSYHQQDPRDSVWCLQSKGYRSSEVERWNAYRKRNYDDSHHHLLVTTGDQSQCTSTSGSHDNHSSDPNLPDQSADLYSVGKMLEKLSTPAGANATETTKSASAFSQLIGIMTHADPTQRSTAQQLLTHPACTHSTSSPTFLDLSLLPTRVVRFINVADAAEFSDQTAKQEIIEDIIEECSKFGRVVKYLTHEDDYHGPQVLVQFSSPYEGIAAYEKLRGRTFSDRTLLLTFYPSHMLQVLLDK